MKIRMVHTLCADWLYGVRIKTYIDVLSIDILYRVSVLGIYMTSRYMLEVCS